MFLGQLLNARQDVASSQLPPDDALAQLDGEVLTRICRSR